MPDPRDPDTEDRRNERELEDRSNNKIEVEEYIDEVVLEVDIFDEESSMIDLDFDDLREMEGPDA